MAATLVVLANGAASQQGITWIFDDLPAGRLPPGLLLASTRNEGPGSWLVVRDGANGVLAHPSRAGRSGTHLAIVGSLALADLTAWTRLRFLEGASSAGLAWRYRDPDNYYAVALDLRAQDVRIYRVVRGNRTWLEDEDDLELDPGMWHTLKVEHEGVRIRVWINGVPAADARDRRRPEPGAVGLWTAGESATWFDELHVEPLRDSGRTNRRE